jgi:hypothetical protein
MARNNDFITPAKIQNKASFFKINDKITGNSEKSIVFINSNILESRTRHCQTVEMAKTRRNTKRLELQTPIKCKVADMRKSGTGFERQIRQFRALCKTIFVNRFD